MTPVLLQVRTIRLITAICFALTPCALAAQERFDVALVIDGSPDRLEDRNQQYVDELLALTGSEFDVRIRGFSGEWSVAGIGNALEQAYADPEIDMVLVTGFTGNQVAAGRSDFPKPTFLPVLLDLGVLASPAVDGKSGIRNLNYLTLYTDFGEDLDTMSSLVGFKNLVLLMGEQLSSVIPNLRDQANAICTERGIELTLVGHDGLDHNLMARVPPETDAVFISGLPRMPQADFDKLVAAINAAGIPSYSFVGVQDVQRGVLVTNSARSNLPKVARLNALNMQAVMIGERTEDQPITFADKKQLTINMATARQIRLSPSFDVLGPATLLNREVAPEGRMLGLAEIAREAVAKNQDLLAEDYGVKASAEEIARARSNLMPQLNGGAAYTSRKDSPAVAAGLFAERSTDTSFNLSQLIFSDSASANLRIQKNLQIAREQSLRQLRMDIIRAAASAYYNVLGARSQLTVQDNNLHVSKSNLDLAKDRQRLGTSTMADVYRWEAEVARAQILVMDARASVDQSWDSLNRLLHRPQGRPIALRPASFEDPFLFTQQEIDDLINSPADYDRFTRFLIDRGFRLAPELLELDAQIAAKRRDVLTQRRTYWLPEFSLQGTYRTNVSQSGTGAGPIAGEDSSDWNVGVQATLPLFTGGIRRANLSRANLELMQLEALRSSITERIEEEIRRQMHLAQAAYARIELSAEAAEASGKNFDLVADAYARGAVSVIDLLDAQDASLSANAASSDSLYNFLITIIAVQRAVGEFDFLLPASERQAVANEIRRYLSNGQN
ncbi:MAG: TolC family protein [Woeseia sp.]